MSTGRLVVAITGASGAPYAVRFLAQAAPHFREIYLMLSSNAPDVLRTEVGITVEELLAPLPQVRLLERKDYLTPPASGSFRHDGMVVIPCSMGVVGRIASGTSDDLITRSADVCLKERRKLLLVVRESPLNLIQLRNLVTVTEAGATVLPAAPGFYHQPKTIDDLLDSVTGRVLQHLGVDQTVVGEWGR